uniref:hypothetical protein n=1 Tax=Candidatus Fervidibacter sp. TaxID=3100871 RepID=UPI00404ABC34
MNHSFTICSHSPLTGVPYGINTGTGWVVSMSTIFHPPPIFLTLKVCLFSVGENEFYSHSPITQRR